MPAKTWNNSFADRYTNSGGDWIPAAHPELVATPSFTTYTWDVGSGTWNAASGADWNPPGNGTIPGSGSDVTIGTGRGGTVTLAQDQTIDGLTITKGYTLSGATHSITTFGFDVVKFGGALSLDNMNIKANGLFVDSGSVTLAGVLTLNGELALSNGLFTGGIKGPGWFHTTAFKTGTLKDVTIYGGTKFTAGILETTNLLGTIADKGAIYVFGSHGDSGFLN
jgi:hypothetical protein